MQIKAGQLLFASIVPGGAKQSDEQIKKAWLAELEQGMAKISAQSREFSSRNDSSAPVLERFQSESAAPLLVLGVERAEARHAGDTVVAGQGNGRTSPVDVVSSREGKKSVWIPGALTTPLSIRVVGNGRPSGAAGSGEAMIPPSLSVRFLRRNVNITSGEETVLWIRDYHQKDQRVLRAVVGEILTMLKQLGVYPERIMLNGSPFQAGEDHAS